MNALQNIPEPQAAQGADTTHSFHDPSGQLPQALVDEIECGLIVCDNQGTIRFANQAAQRELASARVLARQGGLLRRVQNCGDDLAGALHQAALRGRRQLVRLGDGRERLLVSVLPLRLAGAAQPCVLVVLGRRELCSDLGLEMLATRYGLTLAERRVLAALMRETSPREIAAQHAVAMSTVRTQILAIRAKLGTRNIEGLLLRAAEVPPVAGALRLTGLGSLRDEARAAA